MLHAIDNDDSLNPHPDEAPADPDVKEWPPEVWEEDDDLEVEQPTKPYEEDELPLEAARDLDELPADADLVEDESAVDHNLPGNEGMPQ